MEAEKQTEFRDWARVEINGHNTHIGFVTTQVFGAAVLFRIDQPELEEKEETLEKSEWVGGQYCGAGTVVRRAGCAAVSVLVGAGAIYRIIPCDEAAALAAIRELSRRPLMIVRLVEATKRLHGSDPFEFEDGPEDGEQR